MADRRRFDGDTFPPPPVREQRLEDADEIGW
jgi:hypothetical protein